MNSFMARSAGLTALMVAAGVSANAGMIYNFTSFDGPGNNGGGTTVNGINNNGQVVGFSSDNAMAPTLLTNFVRNTNGTFTTPNLNNDPLAMANGINSAGTIVGGSSAGTAFAYNSGLFTTLPMVSGTTASETAFGISDNGLVAGQFVDNATDTTPGYLYKNGTFTVLTPVANALVTNAQSVNNNGLVTGFYSVNGVNQHGFFYNSNTGTFTLAPDPVIANLVLVQFLGINDQGLVSGYYQLPDGSQHGLIYNSNTHQYTFLDDPNAATSGFSITQITGINNSDELTGFYIDANTGLQRGFVATLAPEPGTWVLIAASVLPLMYLRRRGQARS